MALFTASIASGSNGNCYYIGNENEAILIDAGISCRETEKRMKTLSLPVQKLKAIFISHEHSDHIKGVEVLSKKYQLPVFITPQTLRNSRIKIDSSLVRSFVAEETCCIGGLQIKAFSKNHDAIDPHSFFISYNNVNVGVFTDIGEPCDHVIQHFRQCHAAYLETNYDEQMLENGRYPYHLKRRIAGSLGHLSNTQALQLFTEHRSDLLRHLFLSHLSKDNNCPILVKDLFTAHSANTNVIVASRFHPTDVYEISCDTPVERALNTVMQATLF